MTGAVAPSKGLHASPSNEIRAPLSVMAALSTRDKSGGRTSLNGI